MVKRASVNSLTNVAAFCLLILLMAFFVILIIRYFRYKSKEGFENQINIGIMTMMKDPKNLETWLKKNRDVGIKHFYIRLEDTPTLMDYLQDQDDVSLQIGESNGTNEYNEIQNRQNKMVNDFLTQAQTDGYNMDWLIHIDSDELLDGDLDEIRQQPQHVHTFWMQNEEAKFNKIPEKNDNLFDCASVFYDCAKNPEKCVSYGNGKGGARVCKDTRSNGPHRCKSLKSNTKEVKLEKVKVKHYECSDFDSYKKKYLRLSKQDSSTRNDIPFDYYKESIDAALSGNDNLLRAVFTKYRVEN